MTIQIPLY